MCVFPCFCLLVLCFFSPSLSPPPPSLPHWRPRKAQRLYGGSVPSPRSLPLGVCPWSVPPGPCLHFWQQYVLQHVMLMLLSRRSAPQGNLWGQGAQTRLTVAHTCHPRARWVEAGGSEFEVIFGYIVTLRPGGDMRVGLKNKTQTNKAKAGHRGAWRASWHLK